MLSVDMPQVLAAVKDRFSKATDSDAVDVWEAVKGYDWQDFEPAIREARTEKGDRAWRPDVKRIRILTAQRHKSRTAVRFQKESIAAWARRNNLGRGSDLEVLQQHFAACWQRSQEPMVDQFGTPQGEPDGDVARYAQRMIYGYAKCACMDIGCSAEEASALAREWVGLAIDAPLPQLPVAFKGERAAEPQTLTGQPIEHPPTPHQAKQALASAESW